LPVRWAELGTVYRYERSGTLHGLMRVRGFTQDDAHIFCLPDQLTDEIVGVLELTETILGKFGFADYEIMLSTRPEKRYGFLFFFLLFWSPALPKPSTTTSTV
jgi:threonyl-tRNA synthetase